MSKLGRGKLTEREIVSWRQTAKVGRALNSGDGLHLRRQSLDAEGKGRDYWFMRFTSPETGKRGWMAVWGDAAVPYPQASIAEARTKAEEMRKQLAKGVDPLAAKRRDAAAQREADAQAAIDAERRLTVRKLFDGWEKTELKAHIRADGKRTGRKDDGKYSREQFERRIFPKLGNVAAVDVRKGDVLAILDAVKVEGKLRTCNVLLADLKQMMRFAVAREIIPFSPLESVTKRQAGGADTERERVLSIGELAILAALVPASGMSTRSQLAVWAILATGCRVGELMGAQWQHVDTTARTLYLPDTKNERSHTIHLSDFALKQFGALFALREHGTDGAPVPWVFPNSKRSRRGGQPLPPGPTDVKSFGKQLADRQRTPEARMKNRSKATHSLALPGGRWTAHDLRRTAATLMAGLGISTDVIDECLNHKLQSKVARVYIKDRRLTEQARAFDALGAKLDGIVCGTAQLSNVIALAESRSAA